MDREQNEAWKLWVDSSGKSSDRNEKMQEINNRRQDNKIQKNGVNRQILKKDNYYKR